MVGPERSEVGLSDVPAEDRQDGTDTRLSPPPEGNDLLARAGRLVVAAGLGGICLVVGTGLVGHVLAVLGVFTPWPALAVGALVGAGLWAAALRHGGAAALPDGRRTGVGAVAAVVLVVAWTVAAAWTPSQHVVVDRDPASYLTTGIWLANGGQLQAEVATGGLEVLADDELTFRSVATYEVAPQTAEFQFVHHTSVLYALGATVGGPALALRLPALAAGLGLLAVWVVATLVSRRPLLALFPVALLGVGAPLLFAARDTFSEPFSLAAGWWALVVLLTVHRRPNVWLAAVGGLVLGTTVAVRLDALLFVVALVVLGGLSSLAPSSAELRRSRRDAFAVATLAALVPIVVAGLDALFRAGTYFAEHRGMVLAMVALLVVVAAGWAVAWLVSVRRPELRGRVAPLPRSWAVAAGGLVIAVFLFAWFVRPHVQELRFPDLPPRNGARSYYEDTAVWLSWYLGWFGFALSIAGMGWGTQRILRGRASAATVVVVTVTTGLCAVYLLHASVTPEQLWASRRFLPAILPGLAIAASLPIAWLLSRGRPSGPWRLAGAGAAVLLALVPLAASTWPIRGMAQQRGYLDVVLDACDLIGDDATVLVVDPWAANVLPQSLRAWCDVPVAVPDVGFDDAALDRLQRAVDASGRRLVLVAADGDGLAAIPWATGEQRRTRVVVNPVEPDRTFESLPDGYLDPSVVAPPQSPEGFTLWVRPVRPAAP